MSSHLVRTLSPLLLGLTLTLGACASTQAEDDLAEPPAPSAQEASPSSQGPIPDEGDLAAQQAFEEIEPDFQAWMARDAMSPMDARKLKITLEDYVQTAQELKTRYSAVTTQDSPSWQLAAHHRIGEVYAKFASLIETITPPEELPTEQHATYRAQLLDLLFPLNDAALASHRQVLSLASTYQISSSWVTDSQRRVDELTQEREAWQAERAQLDTP